MRMDRRTFAKAGACLAASALGSGRLAAADVPASSGELTGAPFRLSVMLWTVFRDLPFEQRLEKVAEAGYRNVELVGEYEKWTDADFERAIAKRKELGMSFDCTAGLKHGLCNPTDRDALLSEVRNTLPITERLSCPALIFLSGNVVPGLSLEAQQQSCVAGLQAAAALVEGKRIHGEPVRLLLENIDPEENPNYF